MGVTVVGPGSTRWLARYVRGTAANSDATGFIGLRVNDLMRDLGDLVIRCFCYDPYWVLSRKR